MLLAAEKFNSKPLKNDWIVFALEQGLLLPFESMTTDNRYLLYLVYSHLPALLVMCMQYCSSEDV